MSGLKDITVRTRLPLAPFTTFHIGGEARVFIEATTEEEIRAAFGEATRRALPLYPLGAGSNVLVRDEGVEGVVLKVALRDFTLTDDGDDPLLVAGAGLLWDEVVDRASAQGIFGIENLAGIPGTVGGAAVQNIGAYGAEFSHVFEYADVIESTTGEHVRITRAPAAFGYRTSFFKTHRAYVITRVALRLKKTVQPNLAYADLARAQAMGTPLTTPAEIARALRALRAEKFPQGAEEGTAGSFFKNPVIPHEQAAALAARYPGLPVFPQEDGTAKVSLAWLLDHALSLKGFSLGPVRLYEKQPLVIVAREGARAQDVDALAREVEARVLAATGIALAREVETFG